MTPTTTNSCPKCHKPLEQNSKFCANCGNDVSGIWSQNPQLGGTIAIENDPNVDALGQMLSDATLGDYEIYGELGRGGMAAVYLGSDLALNRKVAIKTMLPELVSREGMVARFKREAQTSAALSHPHIIQIYTVKESKQLVYFVMKFIEGRSLESVIVDKGKVPLSMAQTILGQVGSALDYAHRKHVVHRDIKPANIMIDEDGWAIVTDFGIAKVQEAQNLTATGTAIGTPHYMSPEQFHNKAVTGASDQYSLGVVAYEMLAGKKPFDGGTYAEIITQHLFEQPPALRSINPDVPQHVEDAIKKMMAKDPAERFPDLDTAIHSFGAAPTKKEEGVVRTQMISLAKSGPQKKLRMSVPMSPIPATKKRTAPAETAVEPAPAARPPAKKGAKAAAAAAATVVAEKSGGSGKWAVIGLLLVAGGGYFAYSKGMIPGLPPQPAQVVASNPPAPEPQTPTPRTDSATQQGAEAPAAAASEPSGAERLKHVEDSLAQVAVQRKLDSAKAADRDREAARRRRADSIDNARRIAQQSTSRPSGTNTQPVAPNPAPVSRPADPPASIVPQHGWVRIGSRTPGAALYINGNAQGAVTRLQYTQVPAGSVRLEIKADGCVPWDTNVVFRGGDTLPIGFRMAKCPSP